MEAQLEEKNQELQRVRGQAYIYSSTTWGLGARRVAGDSVLLLP